MQLKKFSLFILFGILIICALSDLSSAVVITPGLLRVLQSSIPSAEVSVIVNLAGKADLSQIRDLNKELRRSRIIKALKDKADLTQGPLKALLRNRNSKRLIPLWISNSIAVTVSASVISELMSLPEIENIELDSIIPSPQVLPAAASTPEWNIARVNAPALWSAGITGIGAVVANMDTGVDYLHPDLNPSWRGFVSGHSSDSWYNPYSTPANAPYCGTPNSCDACELSAVTPCDLSPTLGCSSCGHGTGTMGVMVGGSTGGTAIGVAPGAKWIAVKIFPDSDAGAPTSVILQGFQWLLGLPAGSAPDVVNNSWGESQNICDTTFQQSISNLKAAGIAVVFSAGNSGPAASTSVSPANLVGSFGVGATDVNDIVARFSSRGPTPIYPPPPADPTGCDGSIFPHVVAPGVDINTASPGDLYVSESGTSFSAPHVSGGMALLVSTFPNLTPGQLETTLEQTAVSLGSPVSNNDYGYGLIDLNADYKTLLPQNPYTITATAGSGGSISPVGVLHVASGDNLTITLTPNSSYHLADVVVDGRSVCAPFCSSQTVYTFANIQADHTINVIFAPNAKTVGLYDPATGTFYLKNSNDAGVADLTFTFTEALLQMKPVVGDWTGIGIDSVGLYDPVGGTFYLKNSNTTGVADLTFRYGSRNSTWIPVAGDWTGIGIDSVGLYDPVGGTFYLKNSNTTGVADLTFRYGSRNSTWIPVAGDWTGIGIDSVGLYDPVGGTFYLKNSNTTGVADLTFRYGSRNSTWIPVAGDWTGIGIDSVGLYDPVGGTFYLKNSNTTGVADLTFRYGSRNSTWIPVAGDWNGLP